MFRTLCAALFLLAAAGFAQVPERAQAQTAAAPDSTKLIARKIVPAEYPADAVLKRLQGQVVLRVQISETGDVESAVPVSGEQVFHEAAVSAVKQWKFQPFVRNGSPAKVNTTLTVPFSLNDALSIVPDAEATLISETGGVMRVRVAPRTAESHVIQRVPAKFPEFTDAHIIFGSGLSGTVEVQTVISKDGSVLEVKEMSGPPLLRRPASDAVRQYRYRPFVWKGQDVEAVTVVSVTFYR